MSISCDFCLLDDEEYSLIMWAFYLPERVWVQGQIYLALTTIEILSFMM